jgi:hypothetical protein
VTSDRLTRNELTWLLAHEARSAAQKLRIGAASGEEGSTPPPSALEGESAAGFESTLNRLDEAVGMLASLHGQPMSRGRRGKIDVAALVWEIAPDARVQLEMGDGTTVYGDEVELRRMLQMLIGQSGDPTSAKGRSEITIRRQGDEIRVGVHLGPDKPPTFEIERAWLARMATRYGGRLALDGLTHTLTLPADVDSRNLEIQELKKELAEAQAQGEAYARELAAMFARDGGAALAPASSRPGDVARRASAAPPGEGGLTVLIAASRGLASQLRGVLSAIGRDLAPLRDLDGEAGEIAASVSRHVTAASETITDLARLGACPLGELPRVLDVAACLREVVRDEAGRAARHDVSVAIEAPSALIETVPGGTLAALLHALVAHAIVSSPPGARVVITMTDGDGAVLVTFDDAGPPLPAHARSVVLSREFESIATGRSAGLALVAAHAIAAHAGLSLEAGVGEHGGGRLELRVPKLA